MSTVAQPRAWRRRGLGSGVARLLTWPAAVELVMLAAVARFAAAPSAIIPDTWFSLALGRDVATHGLPHVNRLTVLGAGDAWVDQQWLAHLAYYAAYAVGGLSGALTLHLALVLGGVGLAFAGARLLGATPYRSAIVCVAVSGFVLPNLGLRAQSFSQPLLVGVLFLLALDARRPGRRLWLVVPLIALWANLHGAALLGAALVGLRASVCAAEVALQGRGGLSARGGELRRCGAVAAASLAALLASPYALQLPAYYRATAANPAFATWVSEWHPPTLRDQPWFFAAVLGLVAFAAAVFARRGASGPLRRFDAASLALLAAGGLSARRNELWLGLGAIVLVPPVLSALWPERPMAARLQRVVAAAVAVACLVAAAATARALAVDAAGTAYPPAAADAVAAAARAHPHAGIIADEELSDWLLLRRPELAGRIAYDVRFELLSGADLARIDRFRTADPGWDAGLRRFRLVVIAPGAHPALERALRAAGARTLHRDPHVLVLLR